MNVALVLCTLGRDAELAAFIRSLARQTVREWRLIVVDQNSDPDIVHHALRPLVNDERVCVIRETPGLSRARNIGWTCNAQSEWVMFPDDDCLYGTETTLATIVKTLAAAPNTVGAVAFPVSASTEVISSPTLTGFSHQRTLSGNALRTSGLASAGLCFRMSALRAVGGFDEQFGIGARYPADEDVDMVVRLVAADWKAVRAASPNIYHPAQSEDQEKRIRYTFARGALCRKHFGGRQTRGWMLRDTVRYLRQGIRTHQVRTALQLLLALLRGFGQYHQDITSPRHPSGRVPSDPPSPSPSPQARSVVILVTSRITGRGGRETVISRLLPEISRRGTRVLLAMLDNADDPAWAASLPPVLRIASIDPAVAIKRHLIATIRFIRDTLRASGADVVVATEPLAFPIIRLASLWLGSRRPAILSWFHADIRFLRHTWAVRFCDGHLAISEGIADQVKHRWRQPISVIYNPFDADDIQPCPRPARDSDVHLLFIGRLHEQKCADRILTALSKVRATNWRLQIVGDGPELGQLRLLADTLQLSHRIIWSGWSVAPWACVESASLLLLTSRMEGFPLVLVEALARGVPLAAMDCDFGPREVIQRGRNGWLLPQGDVESLARLIDSLCNGEIQLPPEASVIATVERFRVSTVVSSFLKAANEACGRLA